MKTVQKSRKLTFGGFIAAVYEVVGKRKAIGMIRVAVNTRQVGFQGPVRYVLA